MNFANYRIALPEAKSIRVNPYADLCAAMINNYLELAKSNPYPAWSAAREFQEHLLRTTIKAAYSPGLQAMMPAPAPPPNAMENFACAQRALVNSLAAAYAAAFRTVPAA